MYKFYKLLLFLIGALLIAANVYGQKSQGIGTDKPNSRAVLDITVEQPTLFPQGLLLPRLTTVQRNALGTVAGLAAGMAVFDSNDLKFYIWNGSWVAAGTSNITTITGTNIATITTITGGYNIDVPYISILGINGLVVTNVGASFTINGQNIISSQWTTTGNNIYYDKGNVSIGLTTSGAALSILQDASIKPALQLLGGATKSVFLELGRGSTDATIGVAGNASTISGLASPGDFVIKSNTAGSNLILAAKNTSGNILFSTGLSDNLSLFISTGGNIGVGTTAPGATFDVNGNARIRNLSVSGSVLTVDGLGNVGMGIISAGISQWTTTTAGIYINSFVGIGTSTPTSSLHVQDVYSGPGGRTSVKFDIAQTIPNQNNKAIQLNYSVSGTGGTMIFTGFENNITGNPFISPANTMQAYSAIVNVAGNGHVIGYQSSIVGINIGKKTGFDANVQGTGGSQNIGINVIVSGATNNYAALLNGGNVGIGTTAPTTMLDVVGGVRFENLSVSGSILTVDGLGNVGMGTISTSSSSAWQLGGNSLTGMVNTTLGTTSNDPLVFVINGQEKMRLTPTSGNNVSLAINTTSPGFSTALELTGYNGGPALRVNTASLGGSPFAIEAINNQDFLPTIQISNGYGPSGGAAKFFTTSPSNSGTVPVVAISSNSTVAGALGLSVQGDVQFNNLNVAGSVITVDGTGRLGMGTISAGSSQWLTTTGGIYTNTAVGIGVNTFTGHEALRIGGYNPTSPKGFVFPYITTVQMAVLTASGLGPLDAGMGFYVIEYKDVTIWDGAQFSSAGGGNNNNNNNNISYNWDIYGNVSISGTSLSATGTGRLGTADYSGIILQTNNQARISIPASTLAGISIGVGNFLQTVTSTLSVKGDIGLGDGTSTNNGNVVVWLTNSNGSALAPGSIVVVGTSDDSFNATTTASDNSVIGVLTENCPSGNSCRVAVSGIVTVNVNGGSTRGQHCVTSITAGQALSVPVPNVGASIGVFLQTTGGTSARVMLR